MNTAATPAVLQHGDVGVGDDPAAEHEDVVESPRRQLLDDRGNRVMWAPDRTDSPTASASSWSAASATWAGVWNSPV